MAIVVLVVGALLTLMGIAGYLYGLDILPTERGVAVVVSSSVVFTGGVIVLAIGLVLQRLEELSLGGVRPAPPAPAEKAIADGDPEPVELPKIVPVEPKPPAAADRPPVPIEPPKVRAGAAAPPKPIVPPLPPLPAPKAADGIGKTTPVEAKPEPATRPEAKPEPITARIDALTEKLRAPAGLPKLDLPKLDLPKIELPKIVLRPLAKAGAAAAAEAAPEARSEAEASKPAAADASPAAAPMASRGHEVEYPVEVLTPIAAATTDAAATAPDYPAVPMPAEAKSPTSKVEDDLLSTLAAELGLDSPAEPARQETAEQPADRARIGFSVIDEEVVDAPEEAGPDKPASKTAGLGLDIAIPPRPAKDDAAPHKPEPAKQEPAKQEAAGQEPSRPEPPKQAAASEAPKVELAQAAEPKPEPPAAPPIPSPGAEVVGAYESGGAKYTMYSDGSVVAEAGGETLYFKSLEELRDFIDGAPRG